MYSNTSQTLTLSQLSPVIKSQVWVIYHIWDCSHSQKQKRVDGRSDDLIMLRLIETRCIPIFTYGIEVLVFLDSDIRRRLRVAYNSIFRRIFDYRPWQSVTELQSFLSRSTWEELTASRVQKYEHKIELKLFLRRTFCANAHT